MVVLVELDDLKRILKEDLAPLIAKDVKDDLRKELQLLKPGSNNSYVTVKEAAAFFNQSQFTIRKWVNNNSVQSKKIGGTIYVKIT